MRASVGAYIGLLQKELLGENFIKVHTYRELAQAYGRSEKSIELKFQNISAVFDELGLDWLSGLAPMANYQKLLAEEIEKHLPDLSRIIVSPHLSGFEDMASLYLEAPPERESQPRPLPEFMEQLVQKFDPVERDSKNRALGEAGEQLTVEFEKRYLQSIDRADLSNQVVWVSKEEGDGAGFDVLSFDDRGEKKFIEVKTTIGGNRTPFFKSRNELAFSEKQADRYHLRRLFNFRKVPRAFDLNGSLNKFVRISPESYRADFRA